MDNNISFYSKNAETLAAQYDDVPFEAVHKDWLEHIPSEGMVLDVGAGSGRDARYLAAKGLTVVAVEPAAELREASPKYQVATRKPIHWVDDQLPELSKIFALQTKFDLILLSAVWMHIAPSSRERCIRKLSSLLKPNGKLVISLRHGSCHDERTMHPVSASELAEFAKQFGLTYRLLTPANQKDELGRNDVSWQTVLLTLPDDGTGAFPLLRNIVVNDNKSSTYKVALLRALLRIAEGHPGAVIDQSDTHVALPMGLVALYWLKLYKPLIDQYGMQQGSSSGIGFIKDTGWKVLTPYSNNDFYIGASYSDDALGQGLFRALKDISATIKNMPAKYITLPNSQTAVFDVALARHSQPKNAFCLDLDFLSAFGQFSVPRHIWDSLTRFSVWIEPALVNEWAVLMAGYENNRAKQLTKLDYLNALHWEDPKRTTARVRKRAEELMANHPLHCCWTDDKLSASNYAIDHALPFARWPNNDLWNLLPTTTAANGQKSDKLPTSKRLQASRQRILYWWQQGWGEQTNEFFTQATLALPNLGNHNNSYDDVFEALALQRERIKDFQQLEDW
ncbi:methyltransferase type 12 [Idiomarina tyrosinivorans]|uniref:Methyltransferase type 12 n=1 Tax=Idiomarina tyrosinivorans TaxID=1445662 RepID=A0A432ZQ60_9GAMM|nr:class I SAM-dependent methyltransferase [Idiomarina tyrosinivorans]RUO79968.1 methyltransferase type 12 [Idiomarina tyrosinivorans]